jgi:hypothetical protein
VNGQAERFVQTMSDAADAMHHNAGIPDLWWEFALEYAVHIYNQTPLKRHKWKTLFEKVHKTKPSINHLRVFGCVTVFCALL